jgi:DNA invertase Pin-like site-specific DNA recombinase
MLALQQFGVATKKIFLDKISGRDFNRPAYHRMIRKLKKGDVVVVHSIDRLGRNYDEVLSQWRVITKEKKADIVVLDMPLLDTRQGKDLTGILIADIVLQLLSYVAETERAAIRQRQAEGIAAAKLRGVRFGRPLKEPPEGFLEIRERWERGELSGRQAGQLLSVSHHTFFRWVQEEPSSS